MGKTILLVLGAVFVLVGVLGWVPNPIVGMGGIFETDHMHDAVHLLFGVILVAAGLKAAHKAGTTLKVVGGAYLLLAVLGYAMVPQGGMLLGLVHMNAADHILHLALGVVILGLGFVARPTMAAAAPVGAPPSMPQA